jgi:hypothetical protein
MSFIYLYNILGWSSFPSIRPVIHPSKFLNLEGEDDGRGGGGRRRNGGSNSLSKHFNKLETFLKHLKIETK